MEVNRVLLKDYGYNPQNYNDEEIISMIEQLQSTLILDHKSEKKFTLDCDANYRLFPDYIPENALYFSTRHPLDKSSITFHQYLRNENFYFGKTTLSVKIPFYKFCIYTAKKSKSKILLLTPDDIHAFTEQYQVKPSKKFKYTLIDWSKVAKKYSGILFRPYHRLDITENIKFLWYNMIDGETCIIWNLRVLDECS